MYSDKDRLMLTDVSLVFDSERGERVMTMLESLTGAKVSVDPEDLQATDTGHGNRVVFQHTPGL